MKVLVTGGAGYIGSHVCRALREEGHGVAVLDDLSTGHAAAVAGFPLVRRAVQDRAGVAEALRSHGIEGVVHLAGLSRVEQAEERPGAYTDANVAGMASLLEAVGAAGVRFFVFSSSAAVYGEAGDEPLTEEAPLRPAGFYGRTKLFCEWLVEAYGRNCGFRHAILRYFNAAGARADRTIGEDHRPETHLIPRLLQAAMRPGVPGAALTIHGDVYPTPDGTCVRDYVHVQDLAEAHVRALSHLAGGGRSAALNLGTGRGFSVKQVVLAAGRVIGRDIPFRVGPPRRGDPPVLVASNALARDVLGWTPHRSDLETILTTAWAWHAAHPDGYPEDSRSPAAPAE